MWNELIACGMSLLHVVNRGFLWGEQGGLKVLLSVLGDDLGRMPELKKSPNITDTPPFAIALPPFAIALPSQCHRSASGCGHWIMSLTTGMGMRKWQKTTVLCGFYGVITLLGDDVVGIFGYFLYIALYIYL